MPTVLQWPLLMLSVLQWPLFKERWKIILAGAAFQYVHAIFTQLAHRMARPTPEPLHVRSSAKQQVSKHFCTMFPACVWGLSPPPPPSRCLSRCHICFP